MSERSDGARIWGVREPVFFVALGLVLSPVFTLTPWLGRAAWILVAVVHELGHTAAAWFAGCPAAPTLSVLSGQGEAATTTFNPIPALSFAIWAALGWVVVQIVRQERRLIGPGAAVLLVYPLLAFNTGCRELFFLLAGHLGEMTFAGICLWRARTGRSTADRAERAAYACVGWYMLFNHAWLTMGLAAVPSVRAWYEQARSFGIANDYSRAAGQLGVSIETLCAGMFLLTIAIAPAVLYPWRGGGAGRSRGKTAID